MTEVAEQKSGAKTDVRPFQVIDVPQERLDDLRRRIQATVWPEEELVPDRRPALALRGRGLAQAIGEPPGNGRMKVRQDGHRNEF